MDTDLRQSILEANVELHREEAELYDRIHPELDNPDERGRLRRMLDTAVSGLAPGTLRLALDVGAGTGYVTGELLKHGLGVQAVDISDEMLGMLKAKFADEVKAGKILASVKDIDSFLAESVDTYSVITISSVLHHLPDYAATLKLLIQRLATGGALVIFHEPAGGRLSGLEKILQNLDWRLAWRFLTTKRDRELIKSKKMEYGMADYHVTHGFDMEKVREVLDKAGMKIERSESYATAKTGLVRFILSNLNKKRTWCLVARKSD